MPLTISGHQPLYSAPPPFAIPVSTLPQPYFSREGLRTPMSQSCIYSSIAVQPAIRYGHSHAPLTDSYLVDSGSPTSASTRERLEVIPMPSSRKVSARLTPGLSLGATSVGTATVPKHPPSVWRSKDTQSRTIWDSQVPDLKAPKGISTLSPQVSRLAGTSGGNTLTGTDHTLRGMVSNRLCKKKKMSEDAI